MKKEIVYIDKYALILSDEEVKENEYGYIPFEGGSIKLIGKFFADDWKKIIAHLPLSDAPILEGVPLLPSFSWGQQDDVEKLAEKQFPYPVDIKDKNDKIITTYGEKPFNYAKIEKYRRIWAQSYNKAKEKYKYTEEDVRRAYMKGKHGGITESYFGIDEFIKSLQQPSRPTHFECETTEYTVGEMSFMPIGTVNQKPKTITNSQGQVELVGKYI